MGRNNGTYAFGAFVAGLGAGVVLSLLMAPQSGEETRGLITKKAKRGKEIVTDAVDEIKSQVTDSVQDAKARVQGAVQAGAEAYYEELRQKRNA